MWKYFAYIVVPSGAHTRVYPFVNTRERLSNHDPPPRSKSMYVAKLQVAKRSEMQYVSSFC